MLEKETLRIEARAGLKSQRRLGPESGFADKRNSSSGCKTFNPAAVGMQNSVISLSVCWEHAPEALTTQFRLETLKVIQTGSTPKRWGEFWKNSIVLTGCNALWQQTHANTFEEVHVEFVVSAISTVRLLARRIPVCTPDTWLAQASNG
eukprot:1655017-Rhodomonas_salina.2